MVRIEYPTGARVFDALPDSSSRALVIASLMTEAELARFFSVDDLKLLLPQVKLKYSTKAKACAGLRKHFHG